MSTITASNIFGYSKKIICVRTSQKAPTRDYMYRYTIVCAVHDGKPTFVIKENKSKKFFSLKNGRTSWQKEAFKNWKGDIVDLIKTFNGQRRVQITKFNFQYV